MLFKVLKRDQKTLNNVVMLIEVLTTVSKGREFFLRLHWIQFSQCIKNLISLKNQHDWSALL